MAVRGRVLLFFRKGKNAQNPLIFEPTRTKGRSRRLSTFQSTGSKKVVAIRRSEGFDSILDVDNRKKFRPDLSQQEILLGLRKLFPGRLESAGVLVFELEKAQGPACLTGRPFIISNK